MECMDLYKLSQKSCFLQGKAVDLNYRIYIQVGQFSEFESVQCHSTDAEDLY